MTVTISEVGPKAPRFVRLMIPAELIVYAHHMFKDGLWSIEFSDRAALEEIVEAGRIWLDSHRPATPKSDGEKP